MRDADTNGARLARLVLCLSALLVTACESKDHYLIASTGTLIGVEVSQNAASQTPQAKLGYNRAELAIVPTNRTTCTTKEDGTSVICGNAVGNAEDVPEVLMELRYGGIFDLGSNSGIYQRLAIGPVAVTQPGAAFMFAKNVSGNMSSDVAQSVAKANLYKTISEAEYQALLAAEKEKLDARLPKIDEIAAGVRNDGDPSLVDPGKLAALIGAAGLDATSPGVRNLTIWDKTAELKEYLRTAGKEFVDPLHGAL